jgi:hypothetical protein
MSFLHGSLTEVRQSHLSKSIARILPISMGAWNMCSLTKLKSAAVLMTLCVIVGCASVTVNKDPGPLDKGFRFYRPKPYLKITPYEVGKAGGAIGPDEMVEISLEWLPDFSEEYSVRLRTGLGVNKSKIKLENGWMLTEVNSDTDAKFADNVKAVSELAKVVLPFVDPTSAASKAKATAEPDTREATKPIKFVVRATNVPLGYYESVIACSPTGKKQLYGWRYVGFAPFVGCPQIPTGAESCPCDANQVFGLVFDRGVMTFKPLTTIAGTTERDPEPIPLPNYVKVDPAKKPADQTQKAVVTATSDTNRAVLNAALRCVGILPDDSTIDDKPTKTVIRLTTTMLAASTVKNLDTLKKVLQNSLDKPLYDRLEFEMLSN